MTKNNSLLKIGDWIKGKTLEGELIIGYIEAVDILYGAISATVVKSDNKETVGKTIQLLSKHVNKLPFSNVTNKEQIHFLIDLALLTRDEEWFVELSSKLSSMRQLVNEVY